MRTSASGFESATSFACSGELMKPSEIRSSAEYPLSSRGSDHLSPSSLPPSGLATSTWYPCSTNSQYGCVSSDHQKPIGQPVCSETVGLDARMRTRLGLSGSRTSISPDICLAPFAQAILVALGASGAATRDEGVARV